MSIDSWLFEADCSFLNIKNFVPYIRIGILIDENWQNAFSIGISWFSNLSFRKLHIWVFYQGLNWRWYSFKCLSDGIVSDFVPYVGMLIRWTCENVILMFLFCRFPDSNTWCFRLDLSRRGLYGEVLWQYWVIFKCDFLYIRSLFSCATLTENVAVRLRFLLYKLLKILHHNNRIWEQNLQFKWFIFLTRCLPIAFTRSRRFFTFLSVNFFHPILAKLPLGCEWNNKIS